MTDTLDATDTSEAILDELQAWLDENWDPDLTVGEWWERLGLAGWAAPTLPTNAYGKGVARSVGVCVRCAERDSWARSIATHAPSCRISISHHTARIVPIGVCRWLESWTTE